MCACGCLVAAALLGALAYCIMNQMWWAAAGIVVLLGIAGWYGAKAMKKSMAEGEK
jgi:hypothetical protein